MGLKEKINSDLKEALKSGDQFRAGILRLLLAAIHNKEIEAKGKTGSYELSEEAMLAVLAGEAKKRKEAIEIFRRGGRDDLADKEARELQVVQSYLPKQLSLEETEKAVAEIIKRENAKDFGAAMKAVMKELKGKVDAKLAGEIVKKLIGG